MVQFSLYGKPLFPVLVLALSTCAAAVVDKWTPEGFNWSVLDTSTQESWKSLYLNHNNTETHVRELSAITNVDVRTTEDGVTLLVAPWVISLA